MIRIHAKPEFAKIRDRAGEMAKKKKKKKLGKEARDECGELSIGDQITEGLERRVRCLMCISRGLEAIEISLGRE